MWRRVGFGIGILGALAGNLAAAAAMHGGEGTGEANLEWKDTASQIGQKCAAAQVALTASLDVLAKVPLGPKTTFVQTLGAMELALGAFQTETEPLAFYGSVSPDAGVRDAGVTCEKAVRQAALAVFAREDLYRMANFFRAGEKKKGGGKSPAAAGLDPVQRRLNTEYLEAFEDNGLHLDAAKRGQLVALRQQLLDLESDFEKALVDWNEELAFTKAELAGLPDRVLSRLKPATEPGKDWILTLKYPDYIPAMDFLTSPEVRKRLYERFNHRGGEENKARLQKALVLRQEIAKLLGFESHATAVIRTRMAESPAAVHQFLDRLALRLKPLAEKDLAALLQRKIADLGPGAPAVLNPWDVAYYTRLVRQEKFSLDPQELRKYFPLEHVQKVLFQTYQTLLGVEFIAAEGAPVWHPAVKKFQIVDARTRKVVAHFYWDLFPRDGKYGHAAAFTLAGGYRLPGGEYQKPVSAIVANFDPPQANSPSLLSHDELETLFHEFGHIMHQTLTEVVYPSLSGTNVKRDFVEAPSQMLENWVWKEEPLRLLGQHYQTGKPLPADMLTQLLASRRFNQGYSYLRQLFNASIDLAFHGPDFKAGQDTSALYHQYFEKILGLKPERTTIPEAGFGHLMGGYDAGYYGYLWSEVFAADMFSRFDKEGLFNAKAGGDYRRWILAPGGGQKPLALIEGFLGRPASDSAFFNQFPSS